MIFYYLIAKGFVNKNNVNKKKVDNIKNKIFFKLI